LGIAEEFRWGFQRLSLSPPPPALEVVKDDLVASACGDDLVVSPANGAIGPPTILHQPGLADGIDGSPVDQQRKSAVVGVDADAARNG
jgi:hypothetical protein